MHTLITRVVSTAAWFISLYRSQNNRSGPNQSGFKAEHPTETAPLSITDTLHAARSAKLESVLILLDLSATFGTVKNKLLLSIFASLEICVTTW